MLFWIWLSSRYKIPEFFTITHSHLHFDGLLPKSRRSVVSYIGLKVRYKYYKKTVVLVWLGAAHAPITV